MVKGGFFVSLDPELFDVLERVVVERGGVKDSSWFEWRTAQFKTADDRLFTVDEYTEADIDACLLRDGPFYTASGVTMPDMHLVHACGFICRWEDLVVEVGAQAAALAKMPIWLLDGSNVLWDAHRVDPNLVRL